MASHRLFIHTGCATCRRAMAWLKAHDLTVEVVDIVLHPPSLDLLQEALQQAGGKRSRLFNTSGQSYRSLGGASIVNAMDDDVALAALAADGKLIRRPFLVTAAGRIRAGFRPQEWEELLREPPLP